MFSHLKRRIGVLTAVAVLAALVPTLSISPASAAANVLTVEAISSDATYEACPTGAAPAAGFTDTTSTDVDCIAMYGITTGVTATTYEPSASIPRWQMALYLTRFMSKAGYTLGSGADQGFTDISGESAAIQTAINQLAQSGVTLGTTTTTFSPADNVTREQMAMFIERALSKLTAGDGGSSVTTTLVNSAIGGYNYTDIDGGSISFEGHNAVLELFELGVTGDTAAVGLTYRPSENITRAEMATFLTNAAAHTNLRPAGTTIQLSAVTGFGNTAPTASVSYRDAAFVPVSGQVIDMFSWVNSTANGNTSAFNAAGNCAANSNVNIVGNSLTKCTIDVGDPSTNSLGNIAVGAQTVGNATTTTFYAWTGTSATAYDNDLHSADLAQVDATSSANATNVVITCDAPAKAQTSSTTGGKANTVAMHHGATVNLTMQMSSSSNGGITWTNVAQPSNRLTVTHTIYQANSEANVSSVSSSTLYTDANGTATYSLTQADPTTTVQDADDVIHSIVVTDYATGGEVQGAQAVASASTSKCATANAETTPLVFDFKDETTDVPAAQALSTNLSSYLAGSATSGISRTATATLTDKYGDAYATSQTVTFHGATTDALDATAVAGGANNVADAFDLASNMSTAWPAGTAVCFSSLEGGTLDVDDGSTALAVGTVYYISTITNADPAVTTISRTSGGAVLSLAGTPAATNTLAAAHPTMNCAARSTGPAGTASVAWTDTAATSAIDAVAATTSLRATTTDSANAAAAMVKTTTGGTSYRYLAPTTTAISANVAATTTAWVEVSNDNAQANLNAEVTGKPVVVDTTNNTMIVEIAYDTAGRVYVQYAYDSNDHFYLSADSAVGGVATTEAGFEGTFVTGATNPGLLGHKADGTNAWVAGDLDAVTYQSVSGNISVFFLGD